jgi:hypothetical protein
MAECAIIFWASRRTASIRTLMTLFMGDLKLVLATLRKGFDSQQHRDFIAPQQRIG